MSGDNVLTGEKKCFEKIGDDEILEKLPEWANILYKLLVTSKLEQNRT